MGFFGDAMFLVSLCSYLSLILQSCFPRERCLMRLCVKMLLVWDTLW